MARAVRLTKPERELIRNAIRVYCSPWGEQTKGTQKAADGVIQKLDQSEAPPEKVAREYASVQEALTAFQSVLGRRLVIPPNGAGPVFAKMQAQIKSLGLTREQCRLAAMEAGKQWSQGSIKAQSIINQAEQLLQSASESLSQWDDDQSSPSSGSSNGVDVTTDVMTDL